ncbi:hypothetical protein JTE90_006635 [Oedothorax gibbosus]|uniref:THAP domain-containing protein 9 n=1 Tax=Oedothorax gibbosus TaxID=931172 RepID=A0AAV6U6C2_9ARAC|nr:hypothetical protein JTE90_006635 [Oedothorax gibbosus]
MAHLTRGKYPPALRAFALTLQFYFSRAYDYVRTTFKNALPHPSTLRKWYCGIDGESGFSSETFKILESMATNQTKIIVCAIILDKMSIMKRVQYDRKRYRGFVDIGTGEDPDDDTPLAGNALIFMLVSLDSHWKVPLRIFLLMACLEEKGQI